MLFFPMRDWYQCRKLQIACVVQHLQITNASTFANYKCIKAHHLLYMSFAEGHTSLAACGALGRGQVRVTRVAGTNLA